MHVDVRLSDQFSAQCFISVTQFQMYLETDALNYSFEHSMMLLLYCTLYIVDWANFTLYTGQGVIVNNKMWFSLLLLWLIWLLDIIK